MRVFIENDEQYPAVKVIQDTDTPPTGYSEVSSIVGVAKHGVNVIDINTKGWYDKKCVREKLKVMVYTKMQVSLPEHVDDQTKWDLLTLEEKSIATHWFIVGKESFQMEVVNDDRYWVVEAHKYRDWTMKARDSRLKIMEAIVFRRVKDIAYAKKVLSDLMQITKDTVIDIDDITNKLVNKVTAKGMARMYIEGLESVENDGIVAIRDFIDETSGTAFTGGGGFRGLDVTKFRTGHTPDSVANELLNVIDNKW